MISPRRSKIDAAARASTHASAERRTSAWGQHLSEVVPGPVGRRRRYADRSGDRRTEEGQQRQACGGDQIARQDQDLKCTGEPSAAGPVKISSRRTALLQPNAEQDVRRPQHNQCDDHQQYRERGGIDETLRIAAVAEIAVDPGRDRAEAGWSADHLWHRERAEGEYEDHDGRRRDRRGQERDGNGPQHSDRGRAGGVGGALGDRLRPGRQANRNDQIDQRHRRHGDDHRHSHRPLNTAPDEPEYLAGQATACIRPKPAVAQDEVRNE